MAVGTGFGQVFRGIGMNIFTDRGLRLTRYPKNTFISFHSISGQVGGVGIASALFQSILGSELKKRIRGPDAAEVRQSHLKLRAQNQLQPISCFCWITANQKYPPLRTAHSEPPARRPEGSEGSVRDQSECCVHTRCLRVFPRLCRPVTRKLAYPFNYY